jgi:hypothetical protein
VIERTGHWLAVDPTIKWFGFSERFPTKFLDPQMTQISADIKVPSTGLWANRPDFLPIYPGDLCSSAFICGSKFLLGI